MRSLLLLLVIALVCACSTYGNDVEKALDDVFSKAIALDISVYDRDEAYYFNIINQDGYRVCSGTVDKNHPGSVKCAYNHDLLKIGYNLFYVTVYAKQSKAIIFETTTGYEYLPKPNILTADGIKRSLQTTTKSAQDILLGKNVCSGELAPPPIPCTVVPIALYGGTGAIATYSVYRLIRAIRSKDATISTLSKKPEEILSDILPGNSGNGGPKPPFLPPGFRSRLSGIAATLRSSLQKTARARSTQVVGGLLVGAVLLTSPRSRLIRRKIGTSAARVSSLNPLHDSISLVPSDHDYHDMFEDTHETDLVGRGDDLDCVVVAKTAKEEEEAGAVGSRNSSPCQEGDESCRAMEKQAISTM